ncbi:hypothetical protein TRIUR3_09996 [Triticum urartu]|uniref:Uncharacterized protein n=1 Tax=Triticum urartu TaxID=4572 RepID=M7ZP75_TRIUA|nr:hypothetical protein TRIUR3_09996 [Triticum urartu]
MAAANLSTVGFFAASFSTLSENVLPLQFCSNGQMASKVWNSHGDSRGSHAVKQS